jgi:hypothetical protein
MYNTCMRVNTISYISIVLSVFAFLGFFLPPAYASLDFSIVSVEGGNSIRFSRGDLNSGVTKEIRIRVTSSDNVQYQVFQQLVSPFVNQRGVTIDRPVLLASILSGSSGSGTTYLSNYEPVNRGEQLLYTSSANGVSESFTIVYNVDSQYLSDSGSFTGLLQYVVRPVSGGQRQTRQTNVFIESNAELVVNAEGSAAQNLVRIDTKENALPAYATLSFSGNSGKDLAVYMEVLTYPINNLNFELESGILKVSSEGAVNGVLSFQNAVDLPRNRVLVYKSTQQSDSFSFRFFLPPDNLAKLVAGSYRGVIRFSFETDREVKSFNMDLDIKVSPLFEITLDFPRGPISFNSMVLGIDPQIKEVDVQVRSNLHRPYVIKQRVGDLLVNEKGQSIPKEYFVFRQELVDQSAGKLANTDFVPVVPGETSVFYSDASGSPVNFKVFYRLTPFAGMNAGDYKTAIVYDLGEM